MQLKILIISSFFLTFFACNPKPGTPVTVTGDEPTTTLPVPDLPKDTCVECDSMMDCSTNNAICDLEQIYTNPSTCLQVCKKDNATDCNGKPENCIFYKDNMFICAPQCNKLG